MSALHAGMWAAPADGHALCEQLLDAAGAAELREGGQRVGDEAGAEGAEAKLRHCAVVQDLRADVHVLHVVLWTQPSEHCNVVT